LDNVVYRLGFADTRPQARQLVSHAHLMVNGKKVSIPSYVVEPEDSVTIAPRAARSPFFKDRLSLMAKKERPDWLLWNESELTARVVGEPQIEGLMMVLEPNKIVELYSR
jgi:small subunit ribosomal protein S4